MYSWLGTVALSVVVWVVVKRVFYLIKYLIFKIAVLEDIIGHQLGDESGQGRIRGSVRRVLETDYEHQDTFKALRFASRLGLETYDAKLKVFDPNDTIDAIVKEMNEARKNK